MTIPSYFPVLNRMEVLLKSNKNLHESVGHLLRELSMTKEKFGNSFERADDDEGSTNDLSSDLRETTASTSSQTSVQTSSVLLRKLMIMSKKQAGKVKKSNRYEITLKKFASYIFMIGGRMSYELLCSNLPLPSPASVSRYIYQNGPEIIEGKLRAEELKKYLGDNNYTSSVWISEDATRVTNKVQYDPKTNQLVGFALPLQDNEMPKTKSFLATSAKAIENYMLTNPTASLIYVIMAQPLEKFASPFCLSIYTTDNTFTAQDVSKRWEHMKIECAKVGVEILGFSSDGDTRLLATMKNKSGLFERRREDYQNEHEIMKCPWFDCQETTEFDVVQDTVHIGTKMRNRFLKPGIVLPVGDYYFIDVNHLKMLIEQESKDKHKLTATDVNPKDRMNFASVEKICDQKVIECLNKMPEARATCAFLKIVRNCLNCYLEENMSPIDRIYSIWFSVFFLRKWRTWILQHKKYTLGKNFLTTNCYSCVELNAHTLIKIMIKLRDSGREELFIPVLMSSQTCEAFFRQVRSMSSTFSTVVNCTTLDILHRLRRIQLQNEISLQERDNITFPRLKKIDINKNIGGLPSNTEILEAVRKAEDDARKELNLLGIFSEGKTDEENSSAERSNVASSSESDCSTDQSDVKSSQSQENDDGDEDPSLDPSEDLREDIATLSSVKGRLELKNYADTTTRSHAESDSVANPAVNSNSPFAVVTDSTGRELLVRKSSICWLLQKNKGYFSSDRLERFKGISSSFSKMKRTNEALGSPSSSPFSCDESNEARNSVVDEAAVDEPMDTEHISEHMPDVIRPTTRRDLQRPRRLPARFID